MINPGGRSNLSTFVRRIGFPSGRAVMVDDVLPVRKLPRETRAYPRPGRTPRFGLGLALPALVVMGIVFIWPLVQVVSLALQPGYTDDAHASGLTLDNFRSVLTDGAYLSITVTTFVLITVTAVVALVLGYPVAYFIARSESRAAHLIFVVVVAPLLVSAVVRTLGWLILLGDHGPMQALLRVLGLSSGNSLLFNPFAIVVALVHLLLPFIVLSVLASLNGVDRKVEESARVLGASPSQVFWRVTVPQTRPGIVAGLVLVSSLALGTYLTPAFIGGGRTQVLATSIYTETMVSLDWGRASALAVVVMAATLLLIGIGSLLTGRASRLRKAVV